MERLLNDAEKAIMRFVESEQPSRARIFEELGHEFVHRVLQQAFTRLRKAGIIWRVEDDYDFRGDVMYGTEWTPEEIERGYRDA